MDSSEYTVFCGIDVGKSSHYAIALDGDGGRLSGGELLQDEAAIRRPFADLSRHGPVLVVVDQPRNIGALPVAVARDCDIDVAYLPGLRMRRIADLYPGEFEDPDAKDAFIIADTELAVDENRLVNRLRSVLLSMHPAFERAIGKQLHRPVGPGLLARFGGPVGFGYASRAQIDAAATVLAPMLWKKVTDSVVVALSEQPGTPDSNAPCIFRHSHR